VDANIMKFSRRYRSWLTATSVFCLAVAGLRFSWAGEMAGSVSPNLAKMIQAQPRSFRLEGFDYEELPHSVDINPFLTDGEKSKSLLPFLGKLQMLKLYEMAEGEAIRTVLITPFADSKSGIFFTSSLEKTNDRSNLFFQEKHFISGDRPQFAYVAADGKVTETNALPRLITVGLAKQQGVIIWHTGNTVTQGRSNCFRYFRLEKGRGKEGAQVLRPVFSQ